MNVISIPLDKIDQNENSRVIYKATDLSELMHSMKKDGQLQPVGVRQMPDGRYDAVFGNRRIMAAKKLGWSSIDANVILGISDDKERDILNLIENLKRQNTTVAEDGRMFQILKDHGLNETEIAARLDVHIDRVRTALDVFGELPREYHKVIVNRTSGKKITQTISASAAHQILNIRKTHGLSRKQTRTLLDFAKDDDTSLAHVAKIAPLLKAGRTLKEAITESQNLERITLQLFVEKKTLEKIEKKTGLKINEILIRKLEKDPTLGIRRLAEGGHYQHKSAEYTRK